MPIALGLPRRTTFAIGADHLFKHDLEAGTRQTHDFGSRPLSWRVRLRARACADAAEDDGWLIGLVIDMAAARRPISPSSTRETSTRRRSRASASRTACRRASTAIGLPSVRREWPPLPQNRNDRKTRSPAPCHNYLEWVNGGHDNPGRHQNPSLPRGSLPYPRRVRRMVRYAGQHRSGLGGRGQARRREGRQPDRGERHRSPCRLVRDGAVFRGCVAQMDPRQLDRARGPPASQLSRCRRARRRDRAARQLSRRWSSPARRAT